MAPPSGSSNELRDFRERKGMSRQEVADLLNETLDRKHGRPPISESGIRMYERRKLPRSWRVALGLGLEASSTGTVYDFPSADPSLDDGEPGPGAARLDDPPMMPPGARVQTPRPMDAAPGGEMSLVRDRIAKAYNAVGAGLSMATRNDGYSAVTHAYSADLAAAWTNAARENKNVAAIVAFMESGGPVGELVVCHLILVCGFVYVSGRAPALGSILGDSLAPFHRAAAEHKERERLEAEANEFASAGNGAARPLGDAGGFATT
jgi:hypothetical protein